MQLEQTRSCVELQADSSVLPEGQSPEHAAQTRSEVAVGGVDTNSPGVRQTVKLRQTRFEDEVGAVASKLVELQVGAQGWQGSPALLKV